jgi:ubiquinone/menaquinone biosynthesis C-methylase UbiE
MSSEADIEAWNAEADSFDEAPDHGLLDATVRSAWERLLLEKLPGVPARIADLGCGTGTLSVLLADSGHHVEGLDFSPEMIRRAETKAAGQPRAKFIQGDAQDPPLMPGSYDVVLCRHVLWAMPEPAVALSRWIELLKPPGILLLVEGRWSNSVGLTADQTVALVRATGRSAELTVMSDAVYWGRDTHDDRYLVVSPAPSGPVG